MRESTKNSRHVEDFLFVFVHSFPRVVFIFPKGNENIRVRHLGRGAVVGSQHREISRRGAKIPNAMGDGESSRANRIPPPFLTFFVNFGSRGGCTFVRILWIRWYSDTYL